MRRALFSLPLVVAIGIALAAPASALASVSYTDSVKAVQTGFQPGVAPEPDASSFAGLLFGGLPGVFTASVLHAPNPSTVGAGAPILPGGQFILTSFFAGTSLTGAFTRGSVTLAAEGEGCGRQLFRIEADLGGLTGTVSHTPVSGGTATFSGWLLHLRAPAPTPTGTACQTFFATVTGLPPDGSVFPRGGAFFTFG